MKTLDIVTRVLSNTTPSSAEACSLLRISSEMAAFLALFSSEKSGPISILNNYPLGMTFASSF